MAELIVRHKRVGVVCVVATILCGVSRAQQPAAARSALTGSVVGYVECDETQLPARFAKIILIEKPADADLIQVEGGTETSEKPEPHLSKATGTSEMDGRFRIDGVPAGDYLAGALMLGYVMPGTPAAMDVATDEQLKRLMVSMPMVHVNAGQVASVNLTLHRGAVIAGRMEFADGGPAIGVRLTWELAERDLAIQSVRMARPSPLLEIMRQFEYYAQENHGTAATDDEGRYRIFGLSPGKYIVSTIIVSQLGSGLVMRIDGMDTHDGSRSRQSPNLTTVYVPGVFRRGDAKVFEIRGEEHLTDADVKIDMSGLHTIRGKVLADEDRHVPSQAAIRLKEGERDLPQLAMTEEDGSFQINYVPSGSYTLLVTGYPDTTVPANKTEKPRVLRSYQQAKVAVVVGGSDVVLDEVVLTALKPGEKMEWN